MLPLRPFCFQEQPIGQQHYARETSVPESECEKEGEEKQCNYATGSH